MIYAKVRNGIVEEIHGGDIDTVPEGCVDVTGHNVEIEDLFDGIAFSKPNKRYTPKEWVDSITVDEMEAFYTAAETSPALKAMIDRIKTNGIDFRDSAVRGRMQQMVTAGIFTQERADELIGG